MSTLKVVYIAAEMSPYAKTGGLADVAGALPKALKDKGVETISITPKYKLITADFEYVTDFPVNIGNSSKTSIIRKDKLSDPYVYFIDNYELFDKPGIYGHFNDGERYAFFCLAVLEFLKKIDFKPDVIHLNDWHTGPIAMLLKEKYSQDEFYKTTAAVFSIHNIRYQGLFEKSMLDIFGVDEKIFTPESVEYYNRFNFLKAGISYSDRINTVSMTYAEEILTPDFGEGLDGHLLHRKEKLSGIVNGIDIDDFDPESVQDMYYKYSKDEPANKIKNKHKMLLRLGLKKTNDPVFGIISRLVDQKGLDLILDTFSRSLSKGANISLIVLGTGDPYLEKGFKNLAKKYPEKVSANIEFNLKKAKHIYAGSDFFLMPSKFEPCGLGQLISMRYGTIPIVRETGGLKDTVIDFEKDNKKGNGFTFSRSTNEALQEAINRATSYYFKNTIWKRIVFNAMSKDSSWDKAASEYIKLYERTLKEKNVK